MGFPRQEYWSGLLFPSPGDFPGPGIKPASPLTGRQVLTSVMSDSVRPHRWQPSRLPVPGILQARTLEWVAISFSNAWKWKVKGKSLSRVRLLATPWSAAYQAPPPMGFSRQEYWSGVPLLSPSLTYNNTFFKYLNFTSKWQYSIYCMWVSKEYPWKHIFPHLHFNASRMLL